MEKEFLTKCVNDNLSIGDISILIKKSKGSVRYWLNEFDLKTNHLSFKNKPLKEYGDTRYCSRCEDTKPLDEFYNRRGKEGGSVYCKICTSNQTVERQRAFKEKAVEYKGGCCVKCGYNKYQGALEFHHLDPKEKDFSISRVKSYSFSNAIKIELDKCVLVCSNCHKEIHGEII